MIGLLSCRDEIMAKLLCLSFAGSFCILCAVLEACPPTAAAQLHFAANSNFGVDGAYLARRADFDLADIADAAELNSLPRGVEALAWIGLCGGVDARFLEAVRPYRGRAGLFGLYLMDDPDPRGWHSARCTGNDLRAESDWVHSNLPSVKTFIVLMNIGSSRTPWFAATYSPVHSHVDLFGLAPYPCRTELRRCDFAMIGRYVVAAEAAGIPRARMVPVYQVFGGGDWIDDGGGRYVLPTANEEEEIIARWGALLPMPAFDYAYAWGTQRGDVALQDSVGLQAVFLRHNGALKNLSSPAPADR
ncbi:MAG: hypothetical protein ACREFD_08625 [Stellaceae bacterium]